MPITTRTRIACASLAYRTVSAVRGPRRGDVVEVTRGGLRWRLDLREGIDFSIYLLGSFEPSVVRSYRRVVSPGSVVLDIGANVGAHTLPLARAVGATGRVVAFEPTAWAFAKLQVNLALNPELAERVRAEQVGLVGDSGAQVPPAAYSGWPLVGGGELHPDHRGRLESTADATAVTLDDHVSRADLDCVDFVKLDVDGAEPEVLRGGEATIALFRPSIVMELAPYLYDGTDGFDRIVQFLARHGYRIEHLGNGKTLPVDAGVLRDRISHGASMNVLCVGPERPLRAGDVA